jgi:hypothetical protein
MINLYGQDIAKTFYQEKEPVRWLTPSNLVDRFYISCKYSLWYVQTVRYRTIATALPTLPTPPYRCVGQFANTVDSLPLVSQFVRQGS